MPYKLNLARAKKARPFDIPEGETEQRVLRIDSIEDRVAKGGDDPGQPLIHFELVCEDGEYPADNGVRVFREFAINNDQSNGWLREMLEAALGSVLEGDEEDDFSWEPEEVIGQYVVGQCFSELFNGTWYARVGGVEALVEEEEGESAAAPAEEQEAEAEATSAPARRPARV